MDRDGFEFVKEEFRKSDTDGKIEIYVNAENLTQEQYRELLKMYPVTQIEKLETALTAV